MIRIDAIVWMIVLRKSVDGNHTQVYIVYEMYREFKGRAPRGKS